MGDSGYMDAAAVPVPDTGDGALREQLAAALWQVSTARGSLDRDERYMIADALLPRIREHVAAAVQAERERIQALVADAVRAALDGEDADG